MKRGKFSLLRFSLLLALAGLFLYSASVQEIHYIFVNHHNEVNEHCNNHLHQRTSHTECSLCKIELSSYVKTESQFEQFALAHVSDRNLYRVLDVKLNNRYTSISPRGPPASG